MEMQAHMKAAGHRHTRETQSQEAWQKKVRKQDTPPGETNRENISKGAERQRTRRNSGEQGTLRGREESGKPRRAASLGEQVKVILTKETGGGAGRKSFPHQHVLFQKSSKLCWNESERIIESQPAGEWRNRAGTRKR